MKLEEKLISWSNGKKTPKFIPQGGDILKFIGSEMLKVEFKRDPEDNLWKTDNPSPIFVISIGDFDPMTCTYKLVYKEQEGEDKDLRITPEGFSWNNPEEDGWMTRFVSYSTHFTMMEEELYYNNLELRFSSNKGVLSPKELSQFSTGRERRRRLNNINYISAVINTNVEGGLGVGILAFRLSDIIKVEKRGKKWELGIKDNEGDYIQIHKFIEDQESHYWSCPEFIVNGKLLGELKIMDIES